MFPINFSPQEAFTSIPAVIMIFNYHFKYFRFFKRLTDPCDKKMVIATVYGNSVIIFIYGGVGIFGYLTFGSSFTYNKNILNYFS
jgi:amino acid permease